MVKNVIEILFLVAPFVKMPYEDYQTYPENSINNRKRNNKNSQPNKNSKLLAPKSTENNPNFDGIRTRVPVPYCIEQPTFVLD